MRTACTRCAVNSAAAAPTLRASPSLLHHTAANACVLGRQVENFQIISEGGRLENLVCLAPGVRVRAAAAAGPEEADTRTRVDIDAGGHCLRCGNWH